MSVPDPELPQRLRELERQLRDEEIAHENTVKQRDRAEEWADNLAYAIAPIADIGEHSSMNCPWENAYDRAVSEAEHHVLLGDHRRLVEEHRLQGDQLRALLDAIGDVAEWFNGDELTQSFPAIYDLLRRIAAAVEGTEPAPSERERFVAFERAAAEVDERGISTPVARFDQPVCPNCGHLSHIEPCSFAAGPGQRCRCATRCDARLDPQEET